MSYIFLLTILITTRLSWAQSSPGLCVNGPYDSNQDLIQEYNQSISPMKTAFLTYERSHQSPPSSPKKADCGNPSPAMKAWNNIKDLAQFGQENRTPASKPAKPEAKFWGVRQECIDASLHRTTGHGEYSCLPGKSQASKTPECYNKELTEYVQFAVNEGLKCLAPNNTSIAKLSYKRFNDECAFHFGTAWDGGVGLGQLTSAATQEMAEHGKDLLSQVANSKNSACAPFQEIAKKDLATSTPPITNYCSWVNAGEGLSRNIMYSIAFHLHTRKNYIEKIFKKHFKRAHKKHRKGKGNKEEDQREDAQVTAQIEHPTASLGELMDTVTNDAYGRGGLKKSQWDLQKYRVKPNTDPKTVIKKIEKTSPYWTETQGKQKQVLCILKGIAPESPQCKATKFSDSEMEGNTCIQQKP